jgi:hypothetical protein
VAALPEGCVGCASLQQQQQQQQRRQQGQKCSHSA